jgi:hypothetical protein
MKNLIVAGIVGTMLAFATSTRASAHDRFDTHRPGVSYTSRYFDRDRLYPSRGHYADRYTYLGGDFGDRWGCERGIRYPWPTYQGGDHYRPRLTYRW